MSQADIPTALSVLPTAILERPSLEEQSEVFQNLKKYQENNLQVPNINNFEEATRRVGFKDTQKSKTILGRKASRARLGMSSNNSSQYLNESRLSAREKTRQNAAATIWNNSAKVSLASRNAQLNKLKKQSASAVAIGRKPISSARPSKTSLLSKNFSNGAAKLPGQSSTGTLQTIKSLKDKLTRINDMSRDLTDNQLKELLNLGSMIQNRVQQKEGSALSSVYGFNSARSGFM